MNLAKLASLLLVSVSISASRAEMDAVVAVPLHGWATPNHPLTYRVPDGPRGWYQHGFRRENDGSKDWRAFKGVRLELQNPSDGVVAFTVKIAIPVEPTRQSLLPQTLAHPSITGKGRHSVYLPWTSFDFKQAQPAFLKYVKTLQVSSPAPLFVDSASTVLDRSVALSADVSGKSAPANAEVTYEATVSNCAPKPMAVSLSFMREGWESMTATVQPSLLSLAPGQSSKVRVTVKNSFRVPPGGHETQILRAVSGDDSATISFETATELPHPYVLHTAEQWKEVRENALRYDWAQVAKDGYIRRAQAWVVPEIATPPNNLTGVDDAGPFIFPTGVEDGLMDCAIAYSLSGDSRLAEKIRVFMLRLSDPMRGYPVTLRACNQSLVQ
jgi:hypothetical protein